MSACWIIGRKTTLANGHEYPAGPFIVFETEDEAGAAADMVEKISGERPVIIEGALYKAGTTARPARSVPMAAPPNTMTAETALMAEVAEAIEEFCRPPLGQPLGSLSRHELKLIMVTAARNYGDRRASEMREAVADKAREFAAYYATGSDARNAFIILAEWAEAPPKRGETR